MLALAGCKGRAETIEASYTRADGTSETVTMKLASNTDIVLYSLYVPEDWVVIDQSASTMAYVSEENKSSISVAQWNLTSEITSIDTWWNNFHKKENSESFPSFTILEEGKETTLDGREAKNYTYTVAFDGVTYKYNVTASIDQGSIHVITYTSTEELYDETLEVVQGLILPNFKLK